MPDKLQNASHPRQLPWWTWVAPFLIFHVSTRLALFGRLEPGTSLWYLPLTVGFALVQWWGLRVLPGMYINSVLSANLWLGGDNYLLFLLNAAPETLAVFLSWLLFVKVKKGKCWLPNLDQTFAYILLGIFIPATFNVMAFSWKGLYFGDLTTAIFWHRILSMWTGDLLISFTITVPLLAMLTPTLEGHGLSLTDGAKDSQVFRSSGEKFLNAEMILSFLALAFLSLIFPFLTRWWFYGIFCFWIALRFGFISVLIANVWVMVFALIVPVVRFEITVPQILLEYKTEISLFIFISIVAGRIVSDTREEMERRTSAEESLKERNQFIESILNLSPDIMYIFDLKDKRSVYINEGVSNILGFSADELKAMGEQMKNKLMHPDDARFYFEELFPNMPLFPTTAEWWRSTG